MTPVPEIPLYRGLHIVPKRDFGPTGYLIDGKMVKSGFVVTDGSCNVMPGATWFQTVTQAQEAIDVLLAVGGETHSDLFWEIMRGVPAIAGATGDSHDSVSTCGRFSWSSKGGIIASVRAEPREISSAQVRGLCDLMERRPELAVRIFRLGLRFPATQTAPRGVTPVGCAIANT